ncbi:unnamed protein product [Leptosia nina]|uniref:Hemicentin-1 n=1 Tax=Leptosia nina TaxID=320188 RepID=A0AAV1K0H8_9NEOP
MLQKSQEFNKNRFLITERNKHTKTIKKEKEKFRTFVINRYIEYVKNYTRVLETRFPSAMKMYRVFSIGIKDFLRDLKTYITLRIKIARDQGFSNMSRQDIELYEKMPTDMWRIAPVLILSAIPFGNYIIFPLAFLKPRKLLCSHFWSIQQRVEFSMQDLTERLRYNRAVFRALQERLDTIPESSIKEKWERIIALLGSGVHPTANDIIECKELFSKEPYNMKNLTYAHMGSLLRMHGLKKSIFRRKKLKYRAFLLLQMDKAIIREGGVEMLGSESLRNACQIRGLNGSHLSNQNMKDWLQQWLQVSQNVDSMAHVGSKKPIDKDKLASWHVECELGIITDSDCPIDGGWSSWSSWSECQGACDKTGHRKRTRECVNPPPSKDGLPCSGSDQELETCYLNNCNVEDFRKIVKGDPARIAGLNQLEAVPAVADRCLQMECPFEAIEAGLTNENTWQLSAEELWNALQCVKRNLGCPVAGQWSIWDSWSNCGARCGKGLRWRQRKCDAPPPSDARLMCSGAPLQYEECEGDQCAIDDPKLEYSPTGAWSPWGQWTDCSEHCGIGIRHRKRQCVEKHTSHSLFAWRTNCRGQHDQLEVCSSKNCNLDGGWSGWGPWGACSKTCGAGKRSRSRSCTRPIPFGEGANCFGPRTEIGTCHRKPCDVYSNTVALFNGDSVLEYNFTKRHSTFFHFYIRFMPLSPTGTLVRRDKLTYPFIQLLLHKWHLCLDVSGSSKCVLPRICSPNVLAPAVWQSALVTFTNNAAILRINDAQIPLKCSVACEPQLTNDFVAIHVGERFHGAVQEIILNFIPLSMFIEKERQVRTTNLFPAFASNIIYDKANLEEAFITLENYYYLRLPCFYKGEESWQIKLTVKPKTDNGLILFIYDDSSNWILMSLQNMRLKLKLKLGEHKSEVISSSEYQPDHWLDLTLSRKKSANILEATINNGEHLHLDLTDKIMKTGNQMFKRQNYIVQNTTEVLDDICDSSEEKYENVLYKQKRFSFIHCDEEFFVGFIPFYLKKNISEEAIPFSGTIASIHLNGALFNLQDCSMERNIEDTIQLSSRTASISGSYQETVWGKSKKINLTCFYSKTQSLFKNKSYWLFLDTGIRGIFKNTNVTWHDNGRILRLALPENKELRGFYSCRSFYNKRTRNLITYGVIGKVENKFSGPDLTTAAAVFTTLSLVIFTLGWLIIEGINDLREGHGFFRDINLTPEKEAEAVCNYIDKNIHLLGSKSAAKLAKARARRKARQLASRASFAAQEPEGLLQIDNNTEDQAQAIEEETPKEPLPALPASQCFVTEPFHQVFRCEPSYVSSPRHGSNITSPETKLTSSSSLDTSPRNLCSRLLLNRFKYSSKESLRSKLLPRSKRERHSNATQLLTIKSSTLVNLSPAQRILQKFHELRPDDT